jgi:hypothetical protein
MYKNKLIKLTVSSFLVLMALWVATPKVYIHHLLNHEHASIKIGEETQINTPSADEDCDFEEYNKPAYFNIFKFVFSFIPAKSKGSEKISEKVLNLPNVSYAISFLRGPPVTN